MAATPDAPKLDRQPPDAIRLIALDLDGTLLNSQKDISKRNLRALHTAMSLGVKVVFATARPPRGVLTYYQKLGLRTAMVCYNGALVYHPVTQGILLHRYLPQTIAAELVSLARQHYPQVLVHAERLNRWLTDRHDPAFNTETGRMFEPDVVAPIGQWLNSPITKLMLLGDPANMTPLHHAIHEQFPRPSGGYCRPGRHIRVVTTDDHLLQISCASVSKAQGVALIARLYGVEQSQVMAIGDALNDLGMIRWSGWGLAVANALEPVRQVAQGVLPHHDDDAVAVAIERFVLKSGPRRTNPPPDDTAIARLAAPLTPPSVPSPPLPPLPPSTASSDV